jgi:hypothetical protein
MASWELVVTGNSKATINKHNKIHIDFLSILNLFPPFDRIWIWMDARSP